MLLLLTITPRPERFQTYGLDPVLHGLEFLPLGLLLIKAKLFNGLSRWRFDPSTRATASGRGPLLRVVLSEPRSGGASRRTTKWVPRALPVGTHFASWLVAVGYGAFLEGLQLCLPYRRGEWIDVLADGLGALIGIVVMRRP